MNVRVVNLSQWMTDDIRALIQAGLDTVGNKTGIEFLVFSPVRFGTNNNFIDDQTALDGDRTDLQHLAFAGEAPPHYVERMFQALTRKLGAETKALPDHLSGLVVRRRFEIEDSVPAAAILPTLEAVKQHRVFKGWASSDPLSRMAWLSRRLLCCEEQDVEPVLEFLNSIVYRHEMIRLAEMRDVMKASRARRRQVKEAIAATHARMAAGSTQVRSV